MTNEQSIFLEKLYRENQPKLLYYARVKLQNESLAMDVVQDTFHTAIQKIDLLMGHTNAPGWLMETLKNKIKDQIRFRNRYLARFISYDGYENCYLCEDTYVLTDEHRKTVADILSNIEEYLKPQDFYLLKRIILDGASHREVAEELGITIWASQKRLERVRKDLTVLFPQYKKKKNTLKKIAEIMSVILFFGNI